MANTKSAAKRARQTVRRAQSNKRVLSAIKTLLKKSRAEITAKNKEKAQAEFQKLSSALDKAVKTGRLHRNSANRHKSRFSKHIAALAS